MRTESTAVPPTEQHAGPLLGQQAVPLNKASAHYAGFWLRVAAYLVDGCVVSIFLVIFIWEWTCSDWSLYGGPGQGASQCGGGNYFRVIRGGSWYNSLDDVRSTTRNNLDQQNRSYGIGFRLVHPAGRKAIPPPVSGKTAPSVVASLSPATRVPVAKFDAQR